MKRERWESGGGDDVVGFGSGGGVVAARGSGDADGRPEIGREGGGGYVGYGRL